MKAHTHYLWFNTKRRQEIIDITDEVVKQVEVSKVREGIALVSAMHISASVFVNDHESGLWDDILKWLEGTIAPWDPPRYRHNETDEDNAAAHLRSLTVGHEVIVPITAGKLDFGPWQLVVRGRGANGAFDRRYRFTDTWVKRAGRWQIVAAQDYVAP